MNFCTDCGHTLVVRIPAGDTVSRFVCDECQTVHYQNPKLITGCITHWKGKILLCRRAIEPRVGSWTLPAGYMELGESLEQAALREVREETGAKIRLDSLYSVFDIEHIDHVYIIYRGVMLGPEIVVGSECSEVHLFEPAEIPWDNIYYPAIKELLLRYKDDLASNSFSLYAGTSEKGKIFLLEQGEP
ncbi:MAG TPA: NUDIX hydrolase [Gammaproteobacteria bacterium]|nr:NUDIX hydrolase [Gammaproteobacteria bacterium]